ncbi:bile acid:sodium symporter family protein [Actinokineospora pegani]|uniref:bile acid:sodium symporter family protein n=1 Tax=Actinokineospora pegani TaxID=2654637 RepID=UPI0012EA076E|nr:bile acid:sodium symporter family protein [Actinokineospora pegani]
MPRRIRVDPYVLALLATVALASVLPVRGVAATGMGHVTDVVIGVLFFLYGTRLSPREALDGLRHWRLHGTVFLSTFALFPLLGLAARPLVPSVLTPELYTGLLFLCCLPSTVQSSIAFTSIARGNVAAAICAASVSNLVGILVTPLLVGLVITSAGGGFSARALVGISVQLLLPFLLGQVLRRWVGRWLAARKRAVGLVDRGSILLVVYVAFSEGATAGIWSGLSVGGLLALVAVAAVLLAIVLAVTSQVPRLLGFSRADWIATMFAGSKKSLASGLPMAGVLFAGHEVGLVVLPLMLFHQLQLVVCAWLATRLRRAEPSGGSPAGSPVRSTRSA